MLDSKHELVVPLLSNNHHKPKHAERVVAIRLFYVAVFVFFLILFIFHFPSQQSDKKMILIDQPLSSQLPRPPEAFDLLNVAKIERKPQNPKNLDPKFVIETDSRCLCNGENFCFRGIGNDGKLKKGRRFDCNLYEGLKQNGLLDSNARNTAPDYDRINETDWSPLFVSSVSHDHMGEMRAFFRNISSYYPRSKFIIFDIGLRQNEVVELSSWCNVEYRRFYSFKYPPHVANLSTYAFKLIILEVFQTHKTFFYFDSSIRLNSGRLHEFIIALKAGLLLPQTNLVFAPHSIYATTHPGMYEFIPMPLMITQLPEQQSIQLISDSPWYLCAMTRECIAPTGSNKLCSMPDYPDRYRTYMKCHRHDQAFWNLAALAYLYGEQGGVVRLGYSKRNWTHWTERQVIEIDSQRRLALKPLFDMIKVIRRHEINETISWPCTSFSH
ncbi:hypothetical protein M3Y96_01188800 [Aphelenchoides besseyi]|nr:hypothetical protein M3Y96_01188800 [Aphelenchoides besseyi]